MARVGPQRHREEMELFGLSRHFTSFVTPKDRCHIHMSSPYCSKCRLLTHRGCVSSLQRSELFAYCIRLFLFNDVIFNTQTTSHFLSDRMFLHQVYSLVLSRLLIAEAVTCHFVITVGTQIPL